jgi:NAD(P)-dependent dehydrogenase (short-subunit alcohol dehydrogenase family)
MRPVAVVTGAAGAIGTAICDALGDQGWDVIPVDRRPVHRPGAIKLDLANTTAVVDALSSLPAVQGLVNNAAVQLFKPLTETTVEEWDEVAAVNLRAAFVCLKCLHSQLVEAGGAVVNISSVHARATSAQISAYAASKGGLSAFTRAAALEMAPLGVRVNAVVPGAVDTPALRAGFTRRPNAKNELLEQTPLGRIGEPREVAEIVSFLLDRDRSGFMTGQEIAVDGGALARLATE